MQKGSSAGWALHFEAGDGELATRGVAAGELSRDTLGRGLCGQDGWRNPRGGCSSPRPTRICRDWPRSCRNKIR